jgi:hypothetical protein
MGKSDFSSWFSSKADDVKEQNKNLTEYDITINTIKHENMFKGTIVICIVYAIFGFIIVLLSYLSESVRDLLFNKFLPFTIVYIFGSILIISLMLYYIFTFEPVKIDRKNDIDDISCPDYWKVEIIDDKYIGDSFDKIYKNDFKYKCVLDKDIFDKSQMFKYHNLKNYRMTNNIGRTNLLAAADLVGSYDSSKDADFNTDYKDNGKNYNLYVDVNKYKANPSDTYYTATNSKKELSKQLNIYNDSARVDDVLTSLKKIALLENNYSINKDKTATNLLTTSNILNPTGNFGIWKNNNTGLTDATYADLNAISSNNNLLLINWNGLEYNVLSNILNETGITSIKVVSSSLSTSDERTAPGGTRYCLGMIKYKSQTDRNIYFEPYYSSTLLEGKIFNPDGTTSVLNAANIDIKNNIITKTFLYKSTLSTSSGDKAAYTGSAEGVNSISATNDTFIGKKGPILQAYDKTKYRTDTYTAADMSNAANQIPLLCDTVYPKLFSKFENYDIKNENNNDIRCAYSKICGIPWSDLRCNN